MEKEIRKCSKCNQYSYALRRCKLGKINPTTVKGAVSAMKTMGSSYICCFSSVRDKAYELYKKELLSK